MSDRLSGAYWKLWHDVRGRFAICIFLVCAALVGVLAPGRENPRPRACIGPNDDGRYENSWSVMRQYYQQRAADLKVSHGLVDVPGPAGTVRKAPALEQLPRAAQLADGDVLAARCGADKRPNWHYASAVQQYTNRLMQTTWGTMSILMIFIGILLSVGPPFSGESMEAFALTFSLPWSREKWLIHKVALSFVLLVSLVLFVTAVSFLSTRFAMTDGLIGGYPKQALYQDFSAIGTPLLCLLLGCVGIALGTVTSLFARNMLTAAIAAGMIAYLLVGVNLDIGTDRFGTAMQFLPIVEHGNMISTALVLAISALLVSLRLRRTDF